MGHKAVYIETFGCQMNELDSELVTGQLAGLGYRFTADPERADVVLYNTCSVREHAEQKVWSRLGELKARKAQRPGMVVGVLGCMAERDGVDLIRRMPIVDILCGPGELDRLPALLDNAVRTRGAMLGEGEGGGAGARSTDRSANQVALQGNGSRRSATLAAAQDSLELLDLSRAISPTDHHGSAYVRITRGCNKFCTYCVVPFTRGAEIHRPPEHILDECRRLADAGVVEVTLLGQTVNHYRFEHGAAVTTGGITLAQKGRPYAGARRDARAGRRVTTFADLLGLIHEKVPAIRRLRFVTSYPRDLGDDVLETIRDCPRICRYLHVPAQTGSNDILAAMNRGYSIEQYLEFLDRARGVLDQPEIGRPLMVSGDIIVGFPGETEEDYRATVRLLERAGYKNCFIFKYSPRPGTVAFGRMGDDVSEATKRRRNNELLEIQARISDRISREQIGRTFDVLVEGPSKRSLKRSGLAGSRPRTNGAVALTVGGTEPTDGMGARQADRRLDGLGAHPTDGHDRLGAAPGVQLAGRTDGDLIVFFDAPPRGPLRPDDWAGRIVPVAITDADQRSLFGEPIN